MWTWYLDKLKERHLISSSMFWETKTVNEVRARKLEGKSVLFFFLIFTPTIKTVSPSFSFVSAYPLKSFFCLFVRPFVCLFVRLSYHLPSSNVSQFLPLFLCFYLSLFLLLIDFPSLSLNCSKFSFQFFTPKSQLH